MEYDKITLYLTTVQQSMPFQLQSWEVRQCRLVTKSTVFCNAALCAQDFSPVYWPNTAGHLRGMGSVHDLISPSPYLISLVLLPDSRSPCASKSTGIAVFHGLCTPAYEGWKLLACFPPFYGQAGATPNVPCVSMGSSPEWVLTRGKRYL